MDQLPSAPSRRARSAAAITSRTLRPFANRLPANSVGIGITREIVARSMAAFGPPLGGTQVTAVDTTGPLGRVRGEWVRGPGARRWDGCLLYLHGSGYALCSPQTHRGLTSRLSAHTGLPVFSLSYRLAPRHPFPAAADDAASAWAWLVENDYAADHVAVAGDSAGGHLALDLCLSLLRAGTALPSALSLFSPLVDLSFETARAREQLRPDPMLGAAAARRLLRHYVRDVPPTHARIAHMLAEGEALPPTLIQAGGAEMLAADAHRLHRMLRAGGTDSTLEIWPGQMHVFQALPRLVPEAEPALRRAAEFLSDAVPQQAVTRRRRIA